MHVINDCTKWKGSVSSLNRAFHWLFLGQSELDMQDAVFGFNLGSVMTYLKYL